MTKLICIVITMMALGTATLAAQEAPARPPVEAQPPVQEGFSVAAAERALDKFRNGLIGHNQRGVLETLDRQGFADYDRFAGELSSIFDRYDSLRVYSHILQTPTAGQRGIATVEFTMEATPQNDSEPPLRRSTELRFTFARAGKEWKIVDVQPRAFFASF